MLTENISKCLRLQNSKEQDKNNHEELVQQKKLIKELLKEEEIEKQIINDYMEKVREAETKEFTISIEEFENLEQEKHLVEGIKNIYKKEIIELRKQIYRLQDYLYAEEVAKSDEKKDILLQQSTFLETISDSIKKILSQEKELNKYLLLVKDIKYDKNKLRQLKMISKIIVKSPALTLLSLNPLNRELPKFYVSTEGLKNIPESGPCIIAAHHHHSLLDPTILQALMIRPIYFIAAKEVFGFSKIAETLIRGAGMIPYDRPIKGETTFFHKIFSKKMSKYKVDNKKSMIETLKHLQAGDIIGIFPEGDSKTFFPTYKRPRDQEFLNPNTGYVDLSTILKKRYDIDAPIIPVGINYKGIYVTIIAGKPVHVTEDIKGMNGEQIKVYIEEQSHIIFEEIKRLSGY